MGWWETKEGLLGDGPVELVEDLMSVWALEDARPSWQQFLDGLGTALADGGRTWLEDAEALAGRRVCGRFAPSDVEVRSQPDAPRDRYHETLSEALEQLAEEYEETQQRKPRLNEVLGTFAFSLRVAPERFLRNEAGAKLATIHVCADEDHT